MRVSLRFGHKGERIVHWVRNEFLWLRSQRKLYGERIATTGDLKFKRHDDTQRDRGRNQNQFLWPKNVTVLRPIWHAGREDPWSSFLSVSLLHRTRDHFHLRGRKSFVYKNPYLIYSPYQTGFNKPGQERLQCRRAAIKYPWPGKRSSRCKSIKFNYSVFQFHYFGKEWTISLGWNNDWREETPCLFILCPLTNFIYRKIIHSAAQRTGELGGTKGITDFYDKSKSKLY